MQRKQVATDSKKFAISRSQMGSNTLTSERVHAIGGANSPYETHSLSQASRSCNRLTRSIAPTVSMVKPIFDSKYKHPHENERVLQDSHPVKRAALEDAR